MTPRSLAAAGMAALISAAVVAGTVAAVLGGGGGRVVAGKDDRTTERPPAVSSQPVPCDAPRQTLSLAPGALLSFDDETTGAGEVEAYGCRPNWAETGPEHLYVLQIEQDLILDAWLAGNVPDHDLIMLSACHSDSCLAQANTELSGVLLGGSTYYLLVDGYQGAAGPYTLTLQTRHVGLAATICEPGGAVPIAANDDGSVVLAGNLWGADNLVSVYDCSPIAVRGGEVWYALHFPAAVQPGQDGSPGRQVRVAITASTGVANLDLALWLFDGCGPDAACLAFVDQRNAGQSESLDWAHLDPVDAVRYLAVDGIQAPADSIFGTYSLTVTTTVGVERRSQSGVRGLFR